MKRRDFAHMAVAGLAATGGSLVAGKAGAQSASAPSGGVVPKFTDKGFRADSSFYLEGRVRAAHSSKAFDASDYSDGLFADYVSTLRCLMLAYKNGTGVLIGMYHSRLVHDWSGAEGKPFTEQSIFGFLFGYSIERDGQLALTVTQNSHKRKVLTGPRAGLVSTVNPLLHGSHATGLVSGSFIKLSTYQPQPFAAVGDKAKFKLYISRISGEAVRSDFVPNLPDFNVMARDVPAKYQEIIAY